MRDDMRPKSRARRSNKNNELVLLVAQHTRDKHTITICFKGPYGQHFCLFTRKRMAYRRERELWMLL